MKKCVFAGTFDPFTVGHADTVEKCLALFDEVVIAVAENRSKTCRYDLGFRERMVRAVYENEPRVRVLAWEGTIVDLLERENTPFYVRGLRNAVDYEYETTDFYASRDLDGNFVELYFPTEQAHTHISSTLVRNCIAFRKPFSRYVPPAVYRMLSEVESCS